MRSGKVKGKYITWNQIAKANGSHRNEAEVKGL